MDKSKIESNYTQEIILPSKGLLNPEIPEGKLVQRCMMVTDQKFIAGSSIENSSLTKALIERTITAPESFDYGNLTISDTLYILLKLRSLSYGDTYKFSLRCPNCGKRTEFSVDISKLVVNYLDNNYEELLEFVLPRSGDTITLNILRNKDYDEIREEIERIKKKTAADGNEFILRLAKTINCVKLKEENSTGDKLLTHPVDIISYVENLTDLDATAIKAASDRIEYGVNTLVEEYCPNCRETVEIAVPFSSNFFRPKFEF